MLGQQLNCCPNISNSQGGWRQSFVVSQLKMFGHQIAWRRPPCFFVGKKRRPKNSILPTSGYSNCTIILGIRFYEGFEYYFIGENYI